MRLLEIEISFSRKKPIVEPVEYIEIANKNREWSSFLVRL